MDQVELQTTLHDAEGFLHRFENFSSVVKLCRYAGQLQGELVGYEAQRAKLRDSVAALKAKAQGYETSISALAETYEMKKVENEKIINDLVKQSEEASKNMAGQIMALELSYEVRKFELDKHLETRSAELDELIKNTEERLSRAEKKLAELRGI